MLSTKVISNECYQTIQFLQTSTHIVKVTLSFSFTNAILNLCALDAPTQVHDGDSVSASEGDSIDLEMFFLANPSPQLHDLRCIINSTDTPHLYVITKHIKKVTIEDFRSHECTVKNEIGYKTMKWKLSVKNNVTLIGKLFLLVIPFLLWHMFKQINSNVVTVINMSPTGSFIILYTTDSHG